MKSLFSILAACTLVQVHALQHVHPRHLSTALNKASLPGFIPVFFDDFSGTPGSLPSSSNWLFSLGTQYPGGAPNWGNNEHENYTQSRDNIHITQEQNLEIIPRLENGLWTSARIETQDSSFAAAPGGRLLIEARIKLGDAPLEQQQGIWPAFWTLGSRFRGNYSNWPMVTEWDILEVVSGQSTMFSTIHCGYAPGGPCNEYDGLGNGGVSFSRGTFHSVGFLVDRSMCGGGKNGTWQDETLNWYLDGEKVFNVTGATVGDEETWSLLAHEEHYLLLNVAVGGNWPGPPNNATIDGRSVGMEVEHVGVYNSI
ncbi:Glucan endo-1,3-beta-glucosidase [Lachnellula hyalina]|uniref:Glucan endo-1,3-beta-glucosidase n=1 Tax=Lachnellula hyalina TaxID=1316788 RepID=A0A8H8QVD7_9HELO|nr:Glucan endo-1,3-beta-glucosidase [Lachnellula hyalina]TVY23468.1 Glucan endo-1,3-beta-glucosidase [Lachnellula hyalina]